MPKRWIPLIACASSWLHVPGILSAMYRHPLRASSITIFLFKTKKSEMTKNSTPNFLICCNNSRMNFSLPAPKISSVKKIIFFSIEIASWISCTTFLIGFVRKMPPNISLVGQNSQFKEQPLEVWTARQIYWSFCKSSNRGAGRFDRSARWGVR
jgi:hypothetical protein